MIKANVFADYNCPFCYVQHERFRASGLTEEIEWCFIEHAPEFERESTTTSQLAQLKDEHEMAMKRSGELKSCCPDFCVNTRLAILASVSVAIDYPHLTDDFQSAIYQAYWQEGNDISALDVLQKILHGVGGGKLVLHQEAELLQGQNQKKWMDGDFDFRIPALADNYGGVLVGLQNIYNSVSFINQQAFSAPVDDAVCEMQARSVIGLINLVGESRFFEEQGAIYHFVARDSVSHFLTLPNHKKISAVLIGVDASEASWLQISELQHASGFASVPIIVLAKPYNPEISLRAFSMGASDVFNLDHYHNYIFPCLKKRIKDHQVIELLNQYATVDGVTGLNNRRWLQSMMEREWRVACRHKKTLSLLMVDIDCFKAFNDSYGHCAGDECLSQVAGALKKSLQRPTDIIARFGGEEFTAVLPDTDEAGLTLIAERMRKSVEDLAIPHVLSATGGAITISVGGVSSRPYADQTFLQLIEVADKALYLAKSEGKNCVRVDKLLPPEYVKSW